LSILVGKLTEFIFKNESNGFYVYKFDNVSTVIYKGDKPPEPLRTVSYSLYGKWECVKKYGKQFVFHRWDKVALKHIPKNHKYGKYGEWDDD